MHPNDNSLPDKLPLYSVDDVLIEYVDEDTARQLIKEGAVELLRTKRRVRSLRMRAHPRVIAMPKPSRYDMAHRKRPVGQSHKNENETNPAGVWTIDRIPRAADDLFAFSLGKRAA